MMFSRVRHSRVRIRRRRRECSRVGWNKLRGIEVCSGSCMCYRRVSNRLARLSLRFLLIRSFRTGLPAGSQGVILSLLSLNPGLMENLRYGSYLSTLPTSADSNRFDSSALLGKYDIILSLLSTLDDGSATKKVVDSIVDHCKPRSVFSKRSK